MALNDSVSDFIHRRAATPAVGSRLAGQNRRRHPNASPAETTCTGAEASTSTSSQVVPLCHRASGNRPCAHGGVKIFAGLRFRIAFARDSILIISNSSPSALIFRQHHATSVPAGPSNQDADRKRSRAGPDEYSKNLSPGN